MNIKNIINSSDTKIDSMVKIQGTNYDRRRKVTKSMKRRMQQMYDAGKSYYAIAEHFSVDPRTVRYNLDEAFRKYDIELRTKRAKKKPSHSHTTPEKLANRAAYKREIIQNKNARKAVVFG